MGRPRDLGTRAVRRVRTAARADGADRSGLSALLSVHALHAAGDAMVTVALAGTLFFSVPIGEARSSIALYLLLTMLPFALLVPVAGPLLDRFPHGRRNVLAATTGGRGLLTWVMAGAVGVGLLGSFERLLRRGDDERVEDRGGGNGVVERLGHLPR